MGVGLDILEPCTHRRGYWNHLGRGPGIERDHGASPVTPAGPNNNILIVQTPDPVPAALAQANAPRAFQPDPSPGGIPLPFPLPEPIYASASVIA